MPKKKTTKEIVSELRLLYGNKYDYCKVDYKNSKTKICIICKVHGEFWATPNNLLNGHGCPKCKGGVTLTNEEFLGKAEKINNGRYDLSKISYKNSHIKVCVICPKHGEFWIRPNDFLNGIGCPKCANLKKGMYQIGNTKKFINDAIEVHGKEYDYSKVKYTNNRAKVCIICPEHGEFWQTPHNHLRGCGCPNCRQTKLEGQVKKLLNDNNINFFYQYRDKWLGKQSLDFYLPDYNIAIECQGIQHFKPVDFAGKGKEWACENYAHIVEKDKIKNKKCTDKKIKLIYFSNVSKNGIINEENKLLLKIKNNEN